MTRSNGEQQVPERWSIRYVSDARGVLRAVFTRVGFVISFFGGIVVLISGIALWMIELVVLGAIALWLTFHLVPAGYFQKQSSHE
ncbi:hypothetical protein CV102_18255 [Natronococcus pandeyae]|uniref:Uncharacterized protein n=1 Tax=Natronococcus pandeyae TaxID=2055836 RepID=A0A8J8PZD1_9EURY|nr:hypothetical protein [Natronococcus pandeyae]TYL37250.1 hypothetical protein CV102_18255 [Natronococcus pandeyae]